MTTRRDFLKKLMTGAAAVSLSSVLPGVVSARAAGANERIRIGVIGVNSRGNALAQGFAKMRGCEVTLHMRCRFAGLGQMPRRRCQDLRAQAPRKRDLRRLLESEDVDAVVIAMPDHWHAAAAVMAMKAGKHVYLEKPTSHNPAENELLIRAAVKYNRIVQVGNQRRSWPNVIEAIAAIHAGEIGKVRYAKSWYVNNRPSIGVGKEVPVPEWLDWDLWQGPHRA